MTTIDMIAPERQTFLALLQDQLHTLVEMRRKMPNDKPVRERRVDRRNPDRKSQLRLPPQLADRFELSRSDFASCIR